MHTYNVSGFMYESTISLITTCQKEHNDNSKMVEQKVPEVILSQIHQYSNEVWAERKKQTNKPTYLRIPKPK